MHNETYSKATFPYRHPPGLVIKLILTCLGLALFFTRILMKPSLSISLSPVDKLLLIGLITIYGITSLVLSYKLVLEMFMQPQITLGATALNMSFFYLYRCRPTLITYDRITDIHPLIDLKNATLKGIWIYHHTDAKSSHLYISSSALPKDALYEIIAILQGRIKKFD